MAGSRKNTKKLTSADREIWNKITQTAKPLPDSEKNFSYFMEPEVINEASKPMQTKPNPLHKLKDSAAVIYQPPSQPKPEVLPGQLDYSTTKKISKGKIAIDGRLDLHGLTQNQAYMRLYDYIEHAYYANNRIILVITGKGNLGRGVLRENVPKWLAEGIFRRFIASYGESHAAHGGGGALYIRIRKRM